MAVGLPGRNILEGTKLTTGQRACIRSLGGQCLQWLSAQPYLPSSPMHGLLLDRRKHATNERLPSTGQLATKATRHNDHQGPLKTSRTLSSHLDARLHVPHCDRYTSSFLWAILKIDVLLERKKGSSNCHTKFADDKGNSSNLPQLGQAWRITRLPLNLNQHRNQQHNDSANLNRLDALQPMPSIATSGQSIRQPRRGEAAPSTPRRILQHAAEEDRPVRHHRVKLHVDQKGARLVSNTSGSRRTNCGTASLMLLREHWSTESWSTESNKLCIVTTSGYKK